MQPLPSPDVAVDARNNAHKDLSPEPMVEVERVYQALRKGMTRADDPRACSLSMHGRWWKSTTNCEDGPIYAAMNNLAFVLGRFRRVLVLFKKGSRLALLFLTMEVR